MNNPKEKVNLTQSAKCLSIDQSEKAANAIYDLCDLEGRIQQTGNLDEQGRAEIDISDLDAGRYQLFIISEGSIFKSMVNVD